MTALWQAYHAYAIGYGAVLLMLWAGFRVVRDEP